MPGQPYKLGYTDTRYVSAPVTQGQLVMADPDAAADDSGRAKVKPADGGAENVLGVARLSATNAAPGEGVHVRGRNATTIFRKGAIYVTYAAACDDGVLLYAADDGAVTPTPTAASFSTVVGRAGQAVAAAGEGLAYIDV